MGTVQVIFVEDRTIVHAWPEVTSVTWPEETMSGSMFCACTTFFTGSDKVTWPEEAMSGLTFFPYFPPYYFPVYFFFSYSPPLFFFVFFLYFFPPYYFPVLFLKCWNLYHLDFFNHVLLGTKTSNFKKKVFDGPCTAQKNQKMHIWNYMHKRMEILHIN